MLLSTVMCIGKRRIGNALKKNSPQTFLTSKTATLR